MNLFPDTKIFNLVKDGRGVYHSKKIVYILKLASLF